MELTYGSYLKIDELLALQELRSDPPEHDETLFIVIHQVYELWFKQVLHELDRFVELLGDDRPSAGMHQLKRVLKILKTLVAQLDVLETMTPLEFESFREFLADASGFQSVQFRELEFLLGQKNPDHVGMSSKLEARFDAPSVWDAWLAHLGREGFAVPPGATTPSGEVQAILVDIYRNHPALASVCEALTDFDEGLMEWRYRHVMMVQRTIGTKPGTGGSQGAAYLRSTLFNPVFPDLWEIRTAF